MKLYTTIALTLALAAPVQAAEITDDTPARAITVTHDGSSSPIVSSGVPTMKECREALSAILEDMKADAVEGISILCVPADLTDEASVRDLPVVQTN